MHTQLNIIILLRLKSDEYFQRPHIYAAKDLQVDYQRRDDVRPTKYKVMYAGLLYPPLNSKHTIVSTKIFALFLSLLLRLLPWSLIVTACFIITLQKTSGTQTLFVHLRHMWAVNGKKNRTIHNTYKNQGRLFQERWTLQSRDNV